MTSRERALLALTIVGFLVPNTMVTIFFIEHGLDFSDLGLCFALPLFLLLRERAVPAVHG